MDIGNWWEESENNWHFILSSVAPQKKDNNLRQEKIGMLDEAITNTQKGRNRALSSCPVHGGENQFTMFRNSNATGGGMCKQCGVFKNGHLLLTWLERAKTENWEKTPLTYKAKKDTEFQKITWLKILESLNHPFLKYESILKHLPNVKEDSRTKKEINNIIKTISESIWDGAQENHKNITEYFKSIGLEDAETTDFIKFAEKIPNWGYLKIKYQDAIVFPLIKYFQDRHGDNDMKVVGLHRIFINIENNKVSEIKGKQGKKLLRWDSLKGACIPLYPLQGDTLVICKSAENAVALRILSGLPIWAGVTSGGMKNIEIPEGIEHVIIASDYDKKNKEMEKANQIKEIIEKNGKKCTVLSPNMMPIFNQVQNVTWKDVLIKHPQLAFSEWEPYKIAIGPGINKK